MSEGLKVTSTVLYSCTKVDISSRWQSDFRGMIDPSSIHADCFQTRSPFSGAQKCQSNLVHPGVPWGDFLSSFSNRRYIALSSLTTAFYQCQEVLKAIFQRNVDLPPITSSPLFCLLNGIWNIYKFSYIFTCPDYF